MERRTFVRLAAAATVALSLPDLYCASKDSAFTRALSQPNALLHICDAKTIHAIGEAYQRQATNENDKATLVKLLTPGSDGLVTHEGKNNEAITALLNKKVGQDFQQQKIVIVDGWILSVTEARQCALYSITEK